MTIHWTMILFWAATFVVGIVIGWVGYAMTDRYRLNKVCRRALEQPWHLRVDGGSGEWDKPPKITKWKVSAKLERPTRKRVDDDLGW